MQKASARSLTEKDVRRKTHGEEEGADSSRIKDIKAGLDNAFATQR